MLEGSITALLANVALPEHGSSAEMILFPRMAEEAEEEKELDGQILILVNVLAGSSVEKTLELADMAGDREKFCKLVMSHILGEASTTFIDCAEEKDTQVESPMAGFSRVGGAEESVVFGVVVTGAGLAVAAAAAAMMSGVEGGLGRMERPLLAACSMVVWYFWINSRNTEASTQESQGK